MSEQPQPAPKKKRSHPQELAPTSIAPTPAEITESKREALENVPTITTMEELFKIEGAAKGIYEALAIIVGGQENDLYRILERTRLNQYQIELFTDAIQLAEHGIGGESLDNPIPELGEWIVRKMRGYVSLDGDSRAEFERTTTAWITRLWAKSEGAAKEKNPLVGA